MLELLLNNLIYTGLVMGLVAISWTSNFSLALYHNLKLLSEPFDKLRFKNGIFKLGTLTIGTALLVITITFVPIFAKFIGVEIGEEYIQFFSILTIIVMFTKSIFYYTKQAYEKLNGILDFKE